MDPADLRDSVAASTSNFNKPHYFLVHAACRLCASGDIYIYIERA
jgi:hypothetical protein